jgi:hypothetical protein
MTDARVMAILQPVWWRRLSVMVAKELRQLFRDAALIGFLGLHHGYLSSGSGTSMQLVNAGLVVHDSDHIV